MTASNSSRIVFPVSASSPNFPLSPIIRTQINTHLLSTPNAINTLHSTLLHECQASGWLEDVRYRALELLRSGECASYGELMEVICKETSGEGKAANGSGGQGDMNGNRTGNGINGNSEEKGTKERTDVRIPERVVKEGVRIVRDVLEEVVDIETE